MVAAWPPCCLNEVSLLVLDLLPHRLMSWRVTIILATGKCHAKGRIWTFSSAIKGLANKLNLASCCGRAESALEVGCLPHSETCHQSVAGDGNGRASWRCFMEGLLIVSVLVIGSAVETIQNTRNTWCRGCILLTILVIVLLFSSVRQGGRGSAVEPQLAAFCVNLSRSFHL